MSDPHDPTRQEASATGPKLLESLVCPATGGRLEYDAEKGELISRTAMLAYPIRSGIPIMLIDEARKIEG
ncbi:MAG TPA: Trm112 family protein [Thermohalobaculum sp.]|nr:Trm112 family protein [Thermohalobaculum sp.]